MTLLPVKQSIIQKHLKKAVAVSEEEIRSQGGAYFPAAIFLARKSPNLGKLAGVAFRAAGKLGKIVQQRRNLPENPSSKECRTATAFYWCPAPFIQAVNHELSGDPNPQHFPKSTAIQIGGVWQYKWEAYRTAIQMGGILRGIPFFKAYLEARRHSNANRGILPYRLEVYCHTFWKSCTGWGLQNTSHLRAALTFMNSTRDAFHHLLFFQLSDSRH